MLPWAVMGDSGRSDDASSGLLVMAGEPVSDAVPSSALWYDVVGDIGMRVASVWALDIDIWWRTGTGLGDGLGGTES